MKEKVFLAKGIRRVLSLMFCLAVCLILIPMTASAAEEKTPITQVSIRGMERLYAGESVARDDLKKLITVSTTSSSTEVSDAVKVNVAAWIDAETGKVATEIVEGHKYRLGVLLTTASGYYFKADETDYAKFDGRVLMYLDSFGASPYSVNRRDGYALEVESKEMTALPPAFTTQPVGGTSEPGKPFTVHFETGSSEDGVYLDYWSGVAWGYLAGLGNGATSYDIPNKYSSGSTSKFRLRINNGANRSVYSDEFEVTWGRDSFTTQPVGGVCVAGKSYTITFSHVISNNSVELQVYDDDNGNWSRVTGVPNGATSYNISGSGYTSGTTKKFRLALNDAGPDEYVYSDEFEVKWGDDFFTTQPVGGVGVAEKTFAITFSHADTRNTLYIYQYNEDTGEWEYKNTCGRDVTSYNVRSTISDLGKTRKYRLQIKDGAGTGKYVYSDEFEVKWVAEDYVDITHMDVITEAIKNGDNFYTVYIQRGKFNSIGYEVYGIKVGETVEKPTSYGGITSEPFLTVPSSTRTQIDTTISNRYFRVSVGADETLEQIVYYVYPTENKSAGIWLNVIVDRSFDITYDANGGSFTKTLDETVPLSRTYQLPYYDYVTPPAGKLFKCWEYDGKQYGSRELITLNPDCNTIKAIYTYDPFSNQSGDITITCNNMETQKLIVFNLRNIGEIEKAVLEWDSTSSNGVFVRASGSLDLTEEVKSKYVYDDTVKYHSVEVQPYMVGVCRVTVTMNGVPYYGKTFRIKTDPNCHVHDKWHSKGNYYEECYSVCSVCGGDNIYQLHNWEFLGITEYPTETTSGATYYRCTYCDQRKSVSYDGYFTVQPKNIYNKNEGAETNRASVSAAINGWTIERKENSKWETFISDHAEEAHAAGETISFTCGFAGDVWPDVNEYRIKVTVDNDGIIYSEPFVVTEAIKSVEVSDLDMPVAGETLDYDVTIRTNPILSDAVKATKIGWFMPGDTNRLETTVKAVDGQSYYCEIILTPKDGYGFESSEDGKYVNGVTCPYSTKPDTKVDEYGRLHIIFSPVKTGETLPVITEQPVISSLSSNAAGVQVTWGAVDGVTQYRVFYKTATGAWTTFANVKGTSTTVTGLKSGTAYSFLVRCLSADGKTYTDTYDAAKSKSLTYIAQPAVASLSNTSTGVEVKWNAVGGAAQYRVFYKAAGGAWTGFGNTKGTSLVVTGLTAGKTYSFTVRCVSADGKTYTSTYDTTGKSIVYQPAASSMLAKPEIIALSSNSAGVQVTWGAVAGAAQYRVFYKTATGAWTTFANVKGTSTTVTGLTSGTTYTFLVRCLSADGKAYESDYDAAKSKSHTYIAQPAVSSLSNTSIGVEVKWNAVPGAAQYRVFYKAAGGAWTGFNNTTATSLVVIGLDEGTTYSFTVRCVSADGKSYTSTYDAIGKSIVYQPTTSTMLAKPEITALSSNSAGVQITWGAVSGAAQYRVFYKTATGAWTAYGNTNTTGMVVTGLTSGTTYSFLVRCLSADGKAYTSDYDAAMSKSVIYIAQPAVSSVSNTADGVEVKWDAVGGAAQYRVFYKAAGGAWTGYKNTTGTSMEVTGLTKGTTYSFTVRCVSADGKSYTSTYDTTGKSIKVE